MTRREEEAFCDGKLAHERGLFRGQCPRKNPEQRAAWKAGWDEGEKLKLALRVTPEQAEESRRTLSQLKDFAATLKTSASISTPEPQKAPAERPYESLADCLQRFANLKPNGRAISS